MKRINNKTGNKSEELTTQARIIVSNHLSKLIEANVRSE